MGIERIAKQRYLKETAEAAFGPHETKAELYSFGGKLKFCVYLPQPHKALEETDWDTTMSIEDFRNRLRSVRDFITGMGIQLAPWALPALPPELAASLPHTQS